MRPDGGREPTATCDTETLDRLRLIADEHAAMRRIATLVAQGAAPERVFAAVADEVRHVLPAADVTLVGRYDRDRAVELVADWSRAGNWLLGGRGARLVDDAGAVAVAAREMGIRSSASVPISVEGRPWGVMIVGSTREDGVPTGTGQRLAAFTELVATAIANAQAREELRAMADDHAVLRRVSTLVARGRPSRSVFTAIAKEVSQVLPATDLAIVARHDYDDDFTVVGSWGTSDAHACAGSRVGSGMRNVAALVVRTRRPARIESYADAGDADAPNARSVDSTVAAPIIIDGGLWGVMLVRAACERPLATGTEERLAVLTELLAAAIATTEAQAELKASRAQTIARVDAMRRRIERDLHDGAQQRLVSLVLQLRAVQAAVPPGLDEVATDLDQVVAGMVGALEELREYGRGIHPAILAEGLAPALRALARRSPVPVELDLKTEARLPEPVEVATYYVVSEALTNTAKHAHASVVMVTVDTAKDVLHVSVRDDGIGGASPDHTGGTGLAGLRDRVAALGGRISLVSPPRVGTTLHAELPLA